MCTTMRWSMVSTSPMSVLTRVGTQLDVNLRRISERLRGPHPCQ